MSDPTTLLSSSASLLLPHELVDRQRLLYHITFLSSMVQRLQLQQSSATVDEALQRSFDPLIAEGQIRRLDDLLAQQSLMREVDQRRIEGLEMELVRVMEARNTLAKGLQDVGELRRELEHYKGVAVEAQGKLEDVQRECALLRNAERELLQRVATLRREGTTADDHLTVATKLQHARQEQQLRVERLFLEMDETASRQDLFIEDMFFQPLRVALDAAIVFEAEASELRAAEALRAVDVPTLPPVSPNRSLTHATMDTSQQQQESLMLRGELEALRQQNIFLSSQVQRLERLVEGERSRNERIMSENVLHLEKVHEVIMQDRRQFSERLAVEVNTAFREGMLRERAARKAKREAARQQQQSSSKESLDPTTYGVDTWRQQNDGLDPMTSLGVDTWRPQNDE